MAKYFNKTWDEWCASYSKTAALFRTISMETKRKEFIEAVYKKIGDKEVQSLINFVLDTERRVESVGQVQAAVRGQLRDCDDIQDMIRNSGKNLSTDEHAQLESKYAAIDQIVMSSLSIPELEKKFQEKVKESVEETRRAELVREQLREEETKRAELVREQLREEETKTDQRNQKVAATRKRF